MFFVYTHFTHSYLLWYACVCQGQAIHVLLETIFLRAFLILNISSTRPPFIDCWRLPSQKALLALGTSVVS